MEDKTKLLSDIDSEMYLKNWRSSVANPNNPIRIGNTKIKLNSFFLLLIGALVFFLIFFIYLKPENSNSLYNAAGSNYVESISKIYDKTYPLTKPLVLNGQKVFKLGIIADLDKSSRTSKDSSKWISYLKRGTLTMSVTNDKFAINWENIEEEISSGFSLKGRGMELSELVVFNGKLLTVDDRTGIVFELVKGGVLPWVILMDGNGKSLKGFKSEWAAVKNQQLYIGSMGKEWTSAAGEFINDDPMYVKIISANGEVHHKNWVSQYKAVREAVHIKFPGYMLHESVVWSPERNRWYFLPRRCSPDKYNETLDETKGCNYLISADEMFVDIKVVTIGELRPTRGYSTFRFIPGTQDSIIIALKTEELSGTTATYVTIFDITGKIYLDDLKIPTQYKYEGLEFV